MCINLLCSLMLQKLYHGSVFLQNHIFPCIRPSKAAARLLQSNCSLSLAVYISIIILFFEHWRLWDSVVEKNNEHSAVIYCTPLFCGNSRCQKAE